MPVGRTEALAWLAKLQETYAENRERLTELDAAIGDADHGSSLDRGFTAVQTELAANVPADLRTALQSAAMILIKTMGGASGPLYGTFFLRAATACTGREDLDEGAVVAMMRAGIEGVQQRGKASAGDKTMLDTLLPALAAMEEAAARASDLAEILRAGVAAAERGMLSTIPMQARKGRASYLGARSVGHQDAGATSAYLLLRAAAEAWT